MFSKITCNFINAHWAATGELIVKCFIMCDLFSWTLFWQIQQHSGGCKTAIKCLLKFLFLKFEWFQYCSHDSWLSRLISFHFNFWVWYTPTHGWIYTWLHVDNNFINTVPCMWYDQWVTCRQYSILNFQSKSLVHLMCYRVRSLRSLRRIYLDSRKWFWRESTESIHGFCENQLRESILDKEQFQFDAQCTMHIMLHNVFLVGVLS